MEASCGDVEKTGVLGNRWQEMITGEGMDFGILYDKRPTINDI